MGCFLNRHGNIVGRVVVALVCLIGYVFTDWNFPDLHSIDWNRKQKPIK